GCETHSVNFQWQHHGRHHQHPVQPVPCGSGLMHMEGGACERHPGRGAQSEHPVFRKAPTQMFDKAPRRRFALHHARYRLTPPTLIGGCSGTAPRAVPGAPRGTKVTRMFLSSQAFFSFNFSTSLVMSMEKCNPVPE